MNRYWTTTVLVLSGWALYLDHDRLAWSAFVTSTVIAVATYGRWMGTTDDHDHTITVHHATGKIEDSHDEHFIKGEVQ